LIENAFIVLGVAAPHFSPNDAITLDGDRVIQGLAQGRNLLWRKEAVILNIAVVLEELDLGRVNDNLRHISESCSMSELHLRNLVLLSPFPSFAC